MSKGLRTSVVHTCMCINAFVQHHRITKHWIGSLERLFNERLVGDECARVGDPSKHPKKTAASLSGRGRLRYIG